MTRALAALLLLAGAARPQDAKPAKPLSGSALIDHHVQAKWAAAGVKPSRPAEDREFLRRAHLDLCGVIPPADLVYRFLKDDARDKRAKIVDELLESDRYAEYWAEYWEAILLGYDYGVKSESLDTMYAWLRDSVFRRNLPYDEMARRIIAANGSNQKAGEVNLLYRFLRNGGGTVEITTKVARVFMGTQIQCAQCHDHPFDRWTQDDFYGVAAFFARVRNRKVKPEDDRDREFEIFESPRGEVNFPDPKDRRVVPPKFLDGLEPAKEETRRAAFARILTRRENLQFARALVNRYWGHFFGRGMVHPVEEFNDRNRPSHPELLDALARDFIDHGYDLKWLIRALVNSKPYQLSSVKPSKEPPDEKLFAMAQVRTMTPEQFFASMIEATGVEDLFRLQARRQGQAEQVRQAKLNMLRGYRFVFGDDESTDIVDFAGTIPQALAVMNGDSTNRNMIQQNARLDLILRTRKNLGERLDLLFVSILGRHPTNADLQRFVPYLQSKKEERAAFEDVAWVLLNSSEFMFIH
jgi:hypothetical protein